RFEFSNEVDRVLWGANGPEESGPYGVRVVGGGQCRHCPYRVCAGEYGGKIMGRKNPAPTGCRWSEVDSASIVPTEYAESPLPDEDTLDVIHHQMRQQLRLDARARRKPDDPLGQFTIYEQQHGGQAHHSILDAEGRVRITVNRRDAQLSIVLNGDL